MITLAFDTSTLDAAVGWIRTAPATAGDPRPEVGAFSESTSPASPGHAETLIGRVSAALEAGGLAVGDLGLVVFGRGPGTFTGLRLGLATAKGIAVGADVPVVGVSSLEALARSVGGTGRVAALIDARRGELFHCAYEVELADGWPEVRALAEERVAPAAQAIDELRRLVGDSAAAVVGNGVSPYRDQVEAAFTAESGLPGHGIAAPSALWMARVGLETYLKRGGDDPAAVEPRYIREPDARLPSPR